MGPSEKLVLMDKMFVFPCFSYTILLLLKTENIESWLKEKTTCIDRKLTKKTVYKLLKQIFKASISPFALHFFFRFLANFNTSNLKTTGKIEKLL